ncbi:MAG: hypothetical protein BMS9Abin23_0124 [Thermodesulfobacteriota bacterium]|nr:MAG: hypothetical protein BMS9Abin23_0124 [Thermodesulfobacteriota bacterium]
MVGTLNKKPQAPLGIRSFKGVLCLTAVFFLLTACAHSIEKRKKVAETRYRLGVVYYHDGKLPQALKELNTAVQLNPKKPSYHVALALAYFARDLNSDAKKHLKKAIRLKPDFSEARVNLSLVYLMEEDWDNAIVEAGKALENIYYRTPERAYVNMGVAYYNKGAYKEADEKLRKAIKLNPGYKKAYYHLGRTLEKMKRDKRAVRAYTRAVELDPMYVDAYYRLGLTLVKVKDTPGALKAFTKVVELSPGSDHAASARDYIELMR